MKRSAALTCAALAVTATPGVAAAQETGTLIRRPPAQIDRTGPDGARRTMLEYGHCLVRSSPGRVDEVLALRVSDPQYDARLRRLATEECLSGGGLTMSTNLLRGALFEAIYARMAERSTTPDFSAVPPIDHLAGYVSPLSEQTRSILAMSRFGVCVVRASPQLSHQLMFTGIGNQSESEVFNALIPVMSGCITAGETIRLSRSVVRSAVAEGLVLLVRQGTPT